MFLLLIGQKARNVRFDWFIQLSNNRCLINTFAVRLKENRVLNELIRSEEIVNLLSLCFAHVMLNCVQLDLPLRTGPSLIGVRLSSYGCTREVGRAREERLCWCLLFSNCAHRVGGSS